MGVNKAFLLGNLGADPELRYTPSKNAVCTLRLATGERRKTPEGEWVDHTEWHQVVVWGKTAENCAQFLKKGRQIFVEGRIQTRKWEDKEGQARYSTEIIATNVQFVGGGKGEGAGSSIEKSYSSGKGGAGDMPTAPADFGAGGSVSFDDDDIPF